MNINIKDKLVLITGMVVFQKNKNIERWLVVKKDENSDWELPTANVRRVESSVRAAIRTMQEMGGMRAQVMAEAGRFGGSTVVNGKTVPLRYIFYLMKYRDEAGELIGFNQMEWFDYAGAVRKLKSKRDRAIIKTAREELRTLRKTDEGKEILREK
ncbi:hypothetical protein A2975_00840 [Candidatus Woesebacteria bacterium RIFCSPLOWO2_01_FULL_44_14]|uniref:Nudix hydrolase domain-containing protein n=1 Tax=Candidatus Woesebacteria bacterium RIFCSPLOWO2_01_FULL_44_14 TaxID=1802525 RepID=A0A1F8BZW4_9BACT|nr:MAG: hypothetical protein A2975_00840 [Candidatus Woesebacteria bacterium RIFCSPLOWO2_01_FULL_44_14]